MDPWIRPIERRALIAIVVQSAAFRPQTKSGFLASLGMTGCGRPERSEGSEFLASVRPEKKRLVLQEKPKCPR